MNILTINAGSSSIKYQLFLCQQAQFEVLVSGLIEGISEPSGHWRHHGEQKESQSVCFADHKAAFEALSDKLNSLSIDAVGHRVVHGGYEFSQASMITEEVLATIESLSSLAPIHNPINAQGIHFAIKAFPKALQVAVFDTGFHQTMPEKAYRYPVNQAIADKFAIRRYGFHGINHEFVAIEAAKYLQKPLSSCHFISLHLGNGASACLIKNGRSVDTSMGLTPLAGLMMGTRCGDIDPSIPGYLQEQGLSLAEVDKLLNKKSGFIGIAGQNDMRQLLKAAQANDERAILAIDMYVYRIQQYLGAYLSQTPNLDALIFTGGVGENAKDIRLKILSALTHMGFYIDNGLNQQTKDDTVSAISNSGIPILVIKGNEELLIAQQTALCFDKLQLSKK